MNATTVLPCQAQDARNHEHQSTRQHKPCNVASRPLVLVLCQKGATLVSDGSASRGGSAQSKEPDLPARLGLRTLGLGLIPPALISPDYPRVAGSAMPEEESTARKW